MNKSLIVSFVVLIMIVAGVWYWSVGQVAPVTPTPVVVKPGTVVEPTRTYQDSTLNFKLTFPTALSSTTDDTRYRVETVYEYTGMGPNEAIPGVKFTIPRVMTTGTNLSADTYLSVEHLPKGAACDALAFLGERGVAAQVVREGTRSFSFASSTEAAAGNRYEEYVYALSGSDPCIAVRYFVHYGAIENYGTSTVTAFDHAKLVAEFDTIRKTLVVSQ